MATGEAGKVARQFQRLPLLGCWRRQGLLQTLEEVVDPYIQRLRDLIEAAGADAVDARLVLVRLLVGDADQLGHLYLRQPEHDPPLAYSCRDMPIDLVRARAALLCSRRRSRGICCHVSPSFEPTPLTKKAAPHEAATRAVE